MNQEANTYMPRLETVLKMAELLEEFADIIRTAAKDNSTLPPVCMLDRWRLGYDLMCKLQAAGQAIESEGKHKPL